MDSLISRMGKKADEYSSKTLIDMDLIEEHINPNLSTCIGKIETQLRFIECSVVDLEKKQLAENIFNVQELNSDKYSVTFDPCILDRTLELDKKDVEFLDRFRELSIFKQHKYASKTYKNFFRYTDINKDAQNTNIVQGSGHKIRNEVNLVESVENSDGKPKRGKKRKFN